MSRTPFIIGIITVLLIGAVLAYTLLSQSTEQAQNSPAPVPTNSEMLHSDQNVEVISEELSYYPEAKGFYVRPKVGENLPGIVLIHENRGLRPEIKSTATELAKEGYQVLAVDLYKGQVVETQDEARAISGSFNQADGIKNMQAAAKYLRDHGAAKIASWGWCFGGRQSVALATSGEPLDATVVYYGGNMATAVNELEPIDWPVLGIFGDQDQAIPVEKVKEFEASLNTLGVENEIHIYPGVGHAFANPSGANYAPNETMDAWNKTLGFLNKNLKS